MRDTDLDILSENSQEYDEPMIDSCQDFDFDAIEDNLDAVKLYNRQLSSKNLPTYSPEVCNCKYE